MLILLSLEIIRDIIQLKTYLSSHFHMKNFGLLGYFLGISLSERSFFLKENILLICCKKTGTLWSKSIDTLMNSNIHFDRNLEKSLADLGKYRQLIDKTNLFNCHSI